MNEQPVRSALEQIPVEDTTCLLCGGVGGDVIATGEDYEYETSDQLFHFIECGQCGHVYLNPRPSVEAAHIIYPSNYYARSSERENLGELLLGKTKDWVIYRRIAGLLDPLPEGAAWLEVGAGDGALSIVAKRRRPDLHVAALDLQFSDYHRQRLESCGVEVIESLLETADLDRQFDIVVMNQLIEHLWEPKKGLEILARSLTTGGLLSISTPNLDGYDRAYFQSGAWGGYYIPRHLNLFSRESLRTLLLDSGFEIVHHKQLVAPVVWLLSIHNFLKIRGNGLYRLFRHPGVLTLAPLTVLDLIALSLGKPTSNQQIIVRRR